MNDQSAYPSSRLFGKANKVLRCLVNMGYLALWRHYTFAVHAACCTLNTAVYTALLLTQYCNTDGIAVQTAV